MKIEKITENKIRVIVNLDDLEAKHINLHSLMSNSIESQSLFIDMLDEAEKAVGFSTKNCKTYIEAIASSDGNFIFTITKIDSNEQKEIANKKKTVKIKRKTANVDFNKAIYQFTTFEEFCNFCSYIDSSNLGNLKDFAKGISLYLYNDTYFLVLTDINLSYPHLKGFYAIISEFARIVNHPENFERKLDEYGKPIMKKNAIARCLKYFA